MQSYKKLNVYEQSYKQVLAIYEAAKQLPKEETYGLISQLKRAATSIPLNIAEGYGKSEMGKEVLRFLSMARGSSSELEVLLELCKDLGYMEEKTYTELINSQISIGKMLTGLIKSLKIRNTNF